MAGMNPKTLAGLKRYGKSRKTKTIADDLEGHSEIDDPKALAVWVRRTALGPAEFKRHQQGKK